MQNSPCRSHAVLQSCTCIWISSHLESAGIQQYCVQFNQCMLTVCIGTNIRATVDIQILSSMPLVQCGRHPRAGEYTASLRHKTVWQTWPSSIPDPMWSSCRQRAPEKATPWCRHSAWGPHSLQHAICAEYQAYVARRYMMYPRRKYCVAGRARNHSHVDVFRSCCRRALGRD